MTGDLDIQTHIQTINPEQPEQEIIHAAAKLILAGELVAFPTETVYGLGANGLDAAAIEKIFQAKGRPHSDPLILHIADMEMLTAITIEPILPVAYTLAAHFWPGPLTLIVPAHPRVPSTVTAGLDTVAVRLPSHPVARALIRAAGVPIAAPSANRFMHISPTTAEHVLADLAGRIQLILDGGSSPVGVESTIVDVSVDPPLVLRHGGIGLETIQGIVPNIQAITSIQTHVQSEGHAMKAPGQLSTHYAPGVPCYLYKGEHKAVARYIAQETEKLQEKGTRVGILANEEMCTYMQEILPHSSLQYASLGCTDEAAAQSLYSALRRLEVQVDVILGYSAYQTGLGHAVHDRMLRAAGGHSILVSE